MWTGTQTFYCTQDELYSLAPAQNSPHPIYTWLTLDSLTVTGEEGGWVRIDAHYAGAQFESGAGAPEPTKTLSRTLTEQPLATHPMFDSLGEEEKQEAVYLALNPALDDEGKVKLPDTSGWDPLKLDLFNRYRKGQTSYLDPKVTYSREYVSQNEPDDLNAVGETDTPPGAPSVASGRDWLFMGSEMVQRGDVYEIVDTWELSSRDGWDSDIYG